MNHLQYQEQISQLVDNELAEGKSRALFAHLSTCKECRQFLQDGMRLRTGLMTRTLEVPSRVDRNLRQNLAAEMTAAKPTKLVFVRRFRETRIPLSFATAALILMMAGTYALSSFLIRSEAISEPPQERDVYIHMLPAVDVAPHSMNQKTLHH